jgi:glycosyltransferase involved in cell wall biosynthesis
MAHIDRGLAQPLVSVITVCFNESPARIRETLSNIAAQSYERLEQIVVDGGSAEETLAAIREFSDQIDRMISEPDHGIYDAMNKGIRLSSGDFLLFMNVGDRFLTTDTLTEMVRVAVARSAYGFYYGDYFSVDQAGQRLFVPMPKASRFNLYDRVICHQTVLARRELFERIGDFDQAYAPLGDQEWLLRVLSAGQRGLHTGLAVCEFELGGDWSKDRPRLRRARSKMQRQHFSRLERGLFSLSWFALKIGRRFRTGNFAVPVRLAEILNRQRRKVQA